jgi:RHS repeat-associated protein
MKLLAAALFALSHLLGSEVDLSFESSLTATLANDPSSLVDGKVSAITGNPGLASVDLVIQGKEPIHLTRYYLAGAQAEWNLAWDFATAYETPDVSYRWVVIERGEAPLVYKKEGTEEIEGEKFIHFAPSKLNKGLSNTSSGKISARTNPLNHRILFDEKYKSFTVHRADGTIRSYKKVHKSEKEYKLLSEHLPNGNWVFYEYKEIPLDKKSFKTVLSRIYTTNPAQNKTYASALFYYADSARAESFTVVGSDGQMLQYGFNFDGKSSSPLVQLSSSQVLDQQFDYLKYKNKAGEQERLHRVRLPLNRECKLDYYAKDEEIVAGKKIKMDDSYAIDKRRNRVKTLSSAISSNGLNSTYQVSHSFLYDLSPPYRKITSVFDSERNLTQYIYGQQDLRLWEIRRYSQDKELLNVEKCAWIDEKLQWRSFHDASGQALHVKRYVYDSRGNVVEEKLFGNLSGRGSSIVLDRYGRPTESGECYVKRSRYSSEHPSLVLEEEEDAGKRVVYTYLPGTDLPLSQLIYDKDQLVSRKSFEYDEDQNLVCEIEEEESSAVRTIRKILPLASGPYLGMPHVIEDLYWEKGEEKLLRKTVLTYTRGGKISQQDIFDAEGLFRYSLKFFYDEKGRLIEEINALGQSEKVSYDACGNRISSLPSSGRCKIQTDYDLLNRAVGETLRGDDGAALSSRFSYDGRHNLISETNPRGHTVYHAYDALGRRIQTSLPPASGSFSPSIAQRLYDASGNEVTHIDPCGHQTSRSFNSYGKAVLIIHPDGAREENTYNLDGSLQTSVDPLGVVTSYEYDGLGRVVLKRISSKGRTLSEERFAYRGRQLIAHTDPEGYRTLYSYDGAGRKISEERGGEVTFYSYDSLGRRAKIQTGDLCQITEYDLLDRILEERTESSSGELFRKVSYEYDSAGNRAAIIRWVADGEARESLLYDSLNRLIRKTDPMGAVVSIRYDEDFQKTHTDPMGLETIVTYDAQNHPARLEKRKGKTLSLEEKFYTPSGLLATQVNTVFSPDGSDRQIHTRWSYDARGRVIALTEADGTSEAKTTQHAYTLRGELAKTLKPSQTELNYTYDDLGCLVSLSSSDGTVHHSMSYDRLKRLRRQDGIERTLDAQGRCLSEAFPNGALLQSAFDPLGRRISCQIPLANCLIEYGYEGPNLKVVRRKTSAGTPLYAHTYLDYDLSGNLLQEELIGLSTSRRSVDLLGRTYKLDAPKFSQEIEEFDPVGNIRRMRIQGERTTYSYDDLYQLTQEPDHNYLYDSLYNRLAKDGESYEINSLNQIASHFLYNSNGNPIRWGHLTFTYDALDRLIQVETPEGTETYTYDFLHRRLSQTTSQGSTRHFLYDGLNEIGSFDTQQILDLRILGAAPHAEIGSAVAIELQGVAHAPIHDLQGNLAALLPLNQIEPSFFLYSAFGEETLQGSSISPWRFSSKRVDALTGLINFGRRYYSPQFGRWMTPDPAGFTDGMNLYAYVHNDPLTHLDEYGLITFDFRKGWVNCPWGSPYSWSSESPTLLGSPPPAEWNKRAALDMRVSPSIDFRHKYAPHYYVNGMWNAPVDHQRGASVLNRTLGGMANVIPFYSETFGAVEDLLSVFKSKVFRNYSTHSIKRLDRDLRSQILCMDALQDQRKVFVTCFSRGSTDVWHAAKNLSTEQREKLIITACGPIMVLPKSLGSKVMNLISEKDWCSLACNPKLIFNSQAYNGFAEVYLLPQNQGFQGHYFTSSTYQDGIKRLTVGHYQNQGERQ